MKKEDGGPSRWLKRLRDKGTSLYDTPSLILKTHTIEELTPASGCPLTSTQPCPLPQQMHKQVS